MSKHSSGYQHGWLNQGVGHPEKYLPTFLLVLLLPVNLQNSLLANARPFQASPHSILRRRLDQWR